MSYHELPRRELQTRCRDYGLPANKSNAAMATSLISFLADPRTNVLARAPQVLPAAKKSIRARSWSKTERTLETSLASLVLQASESRAQTWMTKPRELHLDGRKLPIAAELPAFVAPSPTKHAESVPQLKVAPLLRRRNSGATPWTGLCFSSVVSGSPHGNLRVVHEEISLQGSGSTVLKKLSTPEPQLLPVLDAAVLSTCNEGPTMLEPIASPSTIILRDQGCQNKNKSCCEERLQASLARLFRIPANVDKLRRQVTTVITRIDEWKDIDELSRALETH